MLSCVPTKLAVAAPVPYAIRVHAVPLQIQLTDSPTASNVVVATAPLESNFYCALILVWEYLIPLRRSLPKKQQKSPDH